MGLLLFLLFIDTIAEIDPDILITSFTDDLKISVRIESIEDAQKEQESIEMLDTWHKANNIEFNVGKFNLIKSSRNNELKDEYTYLAP